MKTVALLIDDNCAIEDSVFAALAEKFAVLTARTLPQAMSLYKEQHPQVIIIDPARSPALLETIQNTEGGTLIYSAPQGFKGFDASDVARVVAHAQLKADKEKVQADNQGIQDDLQALRANLGALQKESGNFQRGTP